MSPETFGSDSHYVAKAAFVAGAEYAEIYLGGSIPLWEIEEAFEEWQAGQDASR